MLSKISYQSFLSAFTILLLCSRDVMCSPPPSSEFVRDIIARERVFGQGKPHAQVMAEVNQLIKTSPSWETYYRRAVLNYRNHQFAAASQDCQQSLKFQKSQAAYYLVAASDLWQGPIYWAKALQATANITRANPETTWSNETGAFIDALRGDYDGCLTHLAAYAAKVALRSQSRYDPPGYSLIGGLRKDQLDQLTAMLGKSDKLKTQRKLLLALTDFFKADYAHSAATSAELVQAGIGRKQKHSSEDDLALALSICNDQMLAQSNTIEGKALQLVRQTNESKASLSFLDTTYFVLGQREKSLAFINHLIERESKATGKSKSIPKLINLLYVRISLDETEPALQDCKAIIKLDPNQAKAQLDICRYKVILGEKKEALAELDSYISKHPGDAAANFWRAQIFVLNNNWMPAVHDLSTAISDGYDILKSLQARAACYRSLHQTKLAADDMALVRTFKVDNAVVIEELSGIVNR